MPTTNKELLERIRLARDAADDLLNTMPDDDVEFDPKNLSVTNKEQLETLVGTMQDPVLKPFRTP